MFSEPESPVETQPVTLASRFFGSVKARLTPLLYAGSSVATAMSQLVSGFLIIKWILPEELGLWQSIKIAQVYAFILLAGVNNGLGRELPFFLGKGEEAFANRLAATAFFCVTLANAIVLLAGVACAIGFANRGPQLVWSILAVTLLIVMGFYQHVFLLTFRSKDSFQKLTTFQWIEAGLSFATVPMVYFSGYNGMLARTLVLSAAVLALMYHYRPMRVKMRMDWEALKLLLKTGLPIFGLDYMKNSCSTLDRVALLGVGGVKEVGIYSLAKIAFQTLAALPKSLSSYLYPRMSFKFGQTGDARALWSSGFKFVLLAVSVTAVAAVGAWLVIPHFIPAFAPKYSGGIRAAQIILIAAIAEGAVLIADALWSMKVWRLMIIYQVASAALFAVGPLLGIILFGRSLEGVAWGVTIAAVSRGLLALGLAYYATHKPGLVKSASAPPSNQ